MRRPGEWIAGSSQFLAWSMVDAIASTSASGQLAVRPPVVST
jgi:hypothetical protein